MCWDGRLTAENSWALGLGLESTRPGICSRKSSRLDSKDGVSWLPDGLEDRTEVLLSIRFRVEGLGSGMGAGVWGLVCRSGEQAYGHVAWRKNYCSTIGVLLQSKMDEGTDRAEGLGGFMWKPRTSRAALLKISVTKREVGNGNSGKELLGFPTAPMYHPGRHRIMANPKVFDNRSTPWDSLEA